MISEKYLRNNLEVSLVKMHSKKTKLPVFALASAVPVMVRWDNNKIEKLDLLDRLPIPMSMLNRLKFMVGKVLTSQEAEKHISADMIKELAFKTYASIKEREEMGYLPDRLTGEKKYFKKLYEVNKRSAKI